MKKIKIDHINLLHLKGTKEEMAYQHGKLLQEEIRKCKSLTSKPFGVNLTLLPSLKPPNYDEFASVIEDEMKSGQLRMIETAGHFKGLAPFVKQFKEAGAYVIHKCVAIRHAKSATKLGVGTWSQK